MPQMPVLMLEVIFLIKALLLAFHSNKKFRNLHEELNQDYVTGARARGMTEKEVLWKQVFPNALLPLITLLGLSLALAPVT